MKNKAKFLESIIAALFTAFMIIILLLGGVGVSYAASGEYSGVLDDLQKDAAFNMSDYPEDKTNTDIEVIQIAESVAGEIFLYTYQPAQNTTALTAKEITMSLTESANNTKVYKLSFINGQGVFCKYKIDEVKAIQNSIRYYNITTIYRDYLPGENKTGNDNEAIYKSIAVGKLFKVETAADGAIKYSCTENPVIEIKNPYVDFLSFSEGSPWDYLFGKEEWTDIHYIAFSPGVEEIDCLQEADVTYTTQTYHYTGLNDAGYSYGEKSEPQYKTIYGEEETGFANKFKWNNILTTKEFLNTVNLNTSAETEVKKTEYILIFLTTQYTQKNLYNMWQGHYIEKDGTKVSDVAILRLQFVKDGICYNLGAVMDKIEADEEAGNHEPPLEPESWLDMLCNWLAEHTGLSASLWKAIIIAIPFLIFLPIIIAVLSALFPVVGSALAAILKGLATALTWLIKILIKIIAWIFKAIIWIISLPFRAIAAIFKDKETPETNGKGQQRSSPAKYGKGKRK